MADLDGEDPPDDRYAYYDEAATQLTTTEFIKVIIAWSRDRRTSTRERRLLASVMLLATGTREQWLRAFADCADPDDSWRF
jgi:hypothetical protein